MEFLSWLFFCLSPFALFCSEDGNGLILCPVFVILGFVFKWIGKSEGSTSKVVVKVEPQKFWQWHYEDCIRKNLVNKESMSDAKMAYEDQEARRWATTICRYHNAPVPSDEQQEKIAASYGVITEKVKRERDTKRDRIQIAKYYLMCKLRKEYLGHIFGRSKNGEHCISPGGVIDKDCLKIKLSDGSTVSNYAVLSKYNLTPEAMWESLSASEKKQATEWIDEYKIKLLENVSAYVKNGTPKPNIDMDF